MKTDKGMGSMKGGKQTVLGGLTNKSPKFPTGYALKPKEANVTRSGDIGGTCGTTGARSRGTRTMVEMARAGIGALAFRRGHFLAQGIDLAAQLLEIAALFSHCRWRRVRLRGRRRVDEEPGRAKHASDAC